MLYLVGGDNLYESQKYVFELKEEFRGKNENAILKVFNADELDDYREILNSAESFTLFSSKKLLIVKRLFSCNKQFVEKVTEYIKEKNDTDFIFWEDKSIDKRRGLFKIIKKSGNVVEFQKPKISVLKTWLTRYLKDRIDFESSAVEKLLLKVGDDQMQLASVVDNLVLLVRADGRRKIRIEDIDVFVAKTAEENIWELMDATFESNKEKALNIMESMLRENKDFIMIVGMIARQFRIIVLVKYLLSLGKNQSEITSVLRLHPFVVKKTSSQSRNFSYDQLKKLYKKLVMTDMAVKEGRFDGKLALDLFITAL